MSVLSKRNIMQVICHFKYSGSPCTKQQIETDESDLRQYIKNSMFSTHNQSTKSTMTYFPILLYPKPLIPGYILHSQHISMWACE